MRAVRQRPTHPGLPPQQPCSTKLTRVGVRAGKWPCRPHTPLQAPHTPLQAPHTPLQATHTPLQATHTPLQATRTPAAAYLHGNPARALHRGVQRLVAAGLGVADVVVKLLQTGGQGGEGVCTSRG